MTSEKEGEMRGSRQRSSTDAEATGVPEKLDSPSKKPSIGSRVWRFLELDVFTLLLMAKGGLPPALALGLLQITVIANHFSTIGYLVAIISVIGMSILPRAKFIQSLITNLVMLCTAAAISLLVGYSSTQARLHTSVITPQSAREYNSSASVVCAVWLFFQVYAANAARAKYPQLQLPVILYSIFSVVTCISMPRFPTMPTVKSFVERLLEAFLAGLACATVVSLLVLPVTVRQVVSKQMNGYVGLLQKCLTSHQAYLRSLEDPQTLEKVMVSEHAADYKPSAEINALNATVSALAGLHSKLQGDLPFAKREVAFGKLGPTKLGGIATHLRRVMLPTIGLFTMNELLERAAHFHGWNEKHLNEGLTDNEELERKTVIRDWNDNLRSLRTSFDPLVSITCQGLEHAALQLELRKRPKSSSSDRDDVEAGAQNVRAGDPEFSKQLEQAIQAHHDGKREMLRDWCSRHGIDFSPGPEVLEDPRTTVSSLLNEHLETSETKQQQDRRQLYMLLYMDFLLWSVSKAVLALVKYSDELVADGTMSKNGIILPGWRRLKKWALTFLNAQEGPTEEPRGELGDFDQAAAFVDLGSAFNQRKDPEHLPPRNAIEKIGNAVRLIPRALRSSASLFGFRVAVATMSVSIVGFLADTQQWFVVHRVLWAIIMVKFQTPDGLQRVNIKCEIGVGRPGVTFSVSHKLALGIDTQDHADHGPDNNKGGSAILAHNMLDGSQKACVD